MDKIVFGTGVQGASHKLSGTEYQDSYKKIELFDGTIILAVADGHGSTACPYSKSGSNMAVNVFCTMLKNLYQNYEVNPEMLLTYLNREGSTKISQAIDYEWKERVLKWHAFHNRSIPPIDDLDKQQEEIYRQYGTTLVGVMITPIYLLLFS